MKIQVIKIGGNVVDNPQLLESFIKDFSSGETDGRKVARILVHGGGVMASQMQRDMGMQPMMIEGRRVTDEATLKVVTMVYAGWCNKNITALLQKYGCNAVGLCGADGNAIRATRRPPLKVGEGTTQERFVDYGFVGDVTADCVNAPFLFSLLQNGMTPVLSAINHDGEGNLLNTNADTIASSVAIALSRHRYRSAKDVCHSCEECHHCSDDGRLTPVVELIYCFEKDGVLLDKEDDNSVIENITETDFTRLKNEGIIADGMIPKLANSFKAIDSGVESVIIKHARNLNNKKGTRLTK